MLPAPDLTKCILCGSTMYLTREHKIKASGLRHVFGSDTLSVVTHGDEKLERPKYAQSTNSKHLKFKSKLCRGCNSERTQPADRAFDELRQAVTHHLEMQGKIDDAAMSDLLPEDDAQRTDLFRYFAKILCCQIADAGGPVPVEIANFAIGRSDVNPINIQVKLDKLAGRWIEETKNFGYAAHGGFVVFGSKFLNWPTAFYSTVTIGFVQFCFHARLNFWGQARLLAEHPVFFEWCRGEIRKAMHKPIGSRDRDALGLSP